MTEFAVELKKITKRFGAVTANDRIDLQVRTGTVHALLGENGSGKSTLMKILFGLEQADDGQILLKGEAVQIATPLDAIRRGIGMIQQEFMLLPNLTVWENLAAGILEKDPAAKRKDLLRADDEICGASTSRMRSGSPCGSSRSESSRRWRSPRRSIRGRRRSSWTSRLPC